MLNKYAVAKKACRIPCCLVLGILLMPSLGNAMGMAAAPEQIELAADQWQANGKVTFKQQQGYPHGLISVKDGGAVLKNRTFGSGTIEYDISEDADNQGIAGIWFRQQDKDTAENFYLRTDSDCPSSIECVQYAPVSHGNVQWDVYPEYQAKAPVHAHGWNHVKLVISGKRMNVYINGEAAPSLQVGRLEGDALSGAIQLRGDATFANLKLTPDATEGLSPAPAKDVTEGDPNYVRSWLLSPALTIPIGQEAAFPAMPAKAEAWEAITAERKGFVNISRKHGNPGGAPDLIWLKTNIDSNRNQSKHVAIGWARQIWVFVNGKPAYADKNFYYPASGRKPPLGRMSLQNGGFDLPLQSGQNEVEIAISNDLHSLHHWGWGFEFRFDNVDGLKMQEAKQAM